jgi:hypothetical protein
MDNLKMANKKARAAGFKGVFIKVGLWLRILMKAMFYLLLLTLAILAVIVAARKLDPCPGHECYYRNSPKKTLMI